MEFKLATVLNYVYSNHEYVHKTTAEVYGNKIIWNMSEINFNNAHNSDYSKIYFSSK